MPNHVPVKERVRRALLAVGLLAYGTYGAFADDIFIPIRRSKGLHFHGVALWLLYGAILFASLSLAALVVDHYDKRPNESMYARLEVLARWLGFGFLGASLFALFLSALPPAST